MSPVVKNTDSRNAYSCYLPRVLTKPRAAPHSRGGEVCVRASELLLRPIP